MSKRNRIFRFGTRGSALARWQTNWVVSRLQSLHDDFPVELCQLSTRGDRDRKTPLRALGGDGLFVKELELALLDGRIDVAVHSLKDLPTVATSGTLIAAIPERAPAGDLFIATTAPTLSACPPGTRIGTGSARRRVQLRWAAPAVEVVDIRGNLDTRLRKLREGQYDAIIVAQAGVSRLGFELIEGLQVEFLDGSVMLPAAGQGALAVQIRQADEELLPLVAAISDQQTTRCVEAERAFLAAVGGGCHHPVAAYGRLNGESLSLQAMVARDESSLLVRLEEQAPVDACPKELGIRVATDAGRWLGTVEGAP